jgi:hypothetical protein
MGVDRLGRHVCAAALQQAVVDFGVVDSDVLQAVLQIPESAAGFARALYVQRFVQCRRQLRSAR